MEKKISFTMKNEKKKFEQKILMGYCPFCIVTERLDSWAGRWASAGARRRAFWARRQAQGRWAGRAWGARQGRVAGVARGRGACVRRRGRTGWRAWSAQAGGRRRLQAGAQGAGRARAGRAGVGWRQACGSRRADTVGTRGARAAERGSKRGRARSVRGKASWAAGAWPGRLARPGCAGWPWAVHSVHSACFWSGSTRYFPESNFLDIVREPGS